MRSFAGPPRLARALAFWCLPEQAREVVLGDLDEEFAEAAALGSTLRAARRHYWRQALGSIIATRRGDRSMFPFTPMHPFRGLSLDVRLVGRTLRASPGYATAAVLSLAIGIGANTAVVSLVRQLLVDPLPVNKPDELGLAYWTHQGGQKLRVNQRNSSGYRDTATGVNYQSNYTYGQYDAIQRASGMPADVAGFNFIRALATTIENRPPVMVAGMLVSGNYFTTVRPSLALGRGLNEADDRPGAAPVAVLGHAFWTSALGGDPGVLGRVVRFNDVPVTVVGVTAAAYRGLSQGGFFPTTDVTLAIAAQPLVVPEWANKGESLFTSKVYWMRIIVRVRPEGLPLATQVIQSALRAEMAVQGVAADAVSTVTARVMPGTRGLDSLRRDTEQPLFILSAVVAAVLMIACVNVAGLMLARSVARQRELAVRRALGAGRYRLIRQLILESLVLSVAGGAAGLLLAFWGGRAVTSMLTAGLGATGVGVSMDWRLFATTAGISCAAGLLCGLLPALRFSRADGGSSLKDRGSVGAPKLRIGRLLLALQIAVSLPLVVGAGLFLRTLHNLTRVDLGFDPKGLLLFMLDPSMAGRFPERPAVEYPLILERLERLPGVRSATLVENALISGWQSNTSVNIDGQLHSMSMNAVGPRYFETMGVPLLQGRTIGPEDRAGSPQAVVLNETAVQRYFHGVSPIGQHFSLGKQVPSIPGIPYGDAEVVGVVADTKYEGLRSDVLPTMFQSFQQRSAWQMHVVLRTSGASGDLQRLVRQAVADVDRSLPLTDFKTQADQIDETTNKERVFSQMLTAFGGFALLLACIGLHGMTSYSVARRTSEIGIRLALGARRSQVLWMVLGQVILLAAVGLILGLPIAWFAGPVIGTFLFGLQPHDVTTMAVSAGVMFIVAVGAGLLPARRAARMEALAALRAE